MTSLENVTASQIEEIASALAVAYAAVKCSESPVPGWMERSKGHRQSLSIFKLMPSSKNVKLGKF